MSKEKRYYLKNRDAILEKRRAKALADKVKKAYELINMNQLEQKFQQLIIMAPIFMNQLMTMTVMKIMNL